MSMWGVFTTIDTDDVHVAPCEPDGTVIGKHTLDTSCWCAPVRDDQEHLLVIHRDPARSLN